jgi:acetolactate synthase-1/2/3 large subunit
MSTNGAAAKKSGMVSGAQALWKALEAEGVRQVFGYPGGAILPVYDALRYSRIHHVLARHEQGATHMADGFARASGQVGVAVATSGPGATNMVTGLATAMLDSSPIVCITGQVHSKLIGSNAFQEVNITAVSKPVTKRNFLVTDPAEVEPTIHEAFRVASSGRPGPVLVDIAKDAQAGMCAWRGVAVAPPKHNDRACGFPSQVELERALEMIRTAERPLILAGHGIILSGAMRETRALAERAHIPVALTLLGLGAFPASHFLHLGMMGMHGEPWVNTAIQEADLVIALGMRFDDRVTGDPRQFAPLASKIHVEIDPTEINKNVKVDVPLVGDLREILSALLPGVEPARHSAWLDYIHQIRETAGANDIQNLAEDGHLYAAHVIRDLWCETGGDSIVVTDVGQHQMWEAQYYKHERPRSLITSGGFGTMGFALPAAIGAKTACPDQEVWAVVGDGGLQMSTSELMTLVQEKLKINIAIINNGYLGMVRQWQEFFFEKNYSFSPIMSPDFARLAEVYGLRGETVAERGGVVPAIRAARESSAPMLIDFRVEREDCVYPIVPVGGHLKQMIRRPAQFARPVLAQAKTAARR